MRIAFSGVFFFGGRCFPEMPWRQKIGTVSLVRKKTNITHSPTLSSPDSSIGLYHVSCLFLLNLPPKHCILLLARAAFPFSLVYKILVLVDILCRYKVPSVNSLAR